MLFRYVIYVCIADHEYVFSWGTNFDVKDVMGGQLRL